jgi:hypothetical protein
VPDLVPRKCHIVFPQQVVGNPLQIDEVLAFIEQNVQVCATVGKVGRKFSGFDSNQSIQSLQSSPKIHFVTEDFKWKQYENNKKLQHLRLVVSRKELKHENE